MLYLEHLLTIRPGVDTGQIFEVLLSSIDDGLWIWNLEKGKFDVLSPAARALFASELDAFNQEPEKWMYLVHPEDRERVLHASTATLFEKDEIKLEYRLVGEAGKQRWVSDCRKIIYHDGKPFQIFGITKDITKQKAYEHRLEETEISHTVMFLNHPNPMWVVNCADGYIMEPNDAAIKQYGYSRKEFQQMKFAQLMKPGSTKLNPAAIKQGAAQVAATHIKKDGKAVNVLITTADFIYLRQPARLMMAVDITREIMDEEKIKDLNKRLQDFKYALTSSSIVSITDKRGIINYVNDNFLKISGYERAELIGSNHNIINSGYHAGSFFKEMWQCISKGEIWRNDIRNKAKDGTYYWVDTYIVPLLDEKGKPDQYISIRNDITGRKQIEDELAELNRMLEERVKKRTQALELANASLQDFAYSISHDLRAPVRHIRNFAQIVLEETKEHMDEEALKYQGYVIQATDRLSQQIEGLLQFSRVGSKLLNYRQIDVEAMLGHVVNQMNLQYNQHPNHFHIGPMPVVNADDVLLEQVFTNLVSNALKYSSKETESHVWVTHENIDGHHQFAVKDNGVGFDMAYAHKLFGMFSRLHSQSEFEGNGIGLANVKRIVERHEGKIWVDSKPGEGATFYFTLSKNLENERQT